MMVIVEFRKTMFFADSLGDYDVLVIVDQLHEQCGEWSLPTTPAFTDAEIMAIGAWAEAGGILWVIVIRFRAPRLHSRRFGFELQYNFALREPDR